MSRPNTYKICGPAISTLWFNAELQRQWVEDDRNSEIKYVRGFLVTNGSEIQLQRRLMTPSEYDFTLSWKGQTDKNRIGDILAHNIYTTPSIKISELLDDPLKVVEAVGTLDRNILELAKVDYPIY